MDFKIGWTLPMWREFCATADSASAIALAWSRDAHHFNGRAFRLAFDAAGEALVLRFGYRPTAALAYLAETGLDCCRGCGAAAVRYELDASLGTPVCPACLAEVQATIDAAADERREALIEAQAAEGERCAAVAA